jgi:uncharacterized protein YbjT (DUF2867 family)
MDDPQGKIALLAGASGLVGTQLLDALLDARDFSRVYAVTRRQLGREHARLANRIVQFDRLEAQLKGMSCHTAFCCIGAPRRDATPQGLRQEGAHVLAFAQAAKAAGAQRLVFLSCASADADSAKPRARHKGELEQSLEALGFGALDILQPGPLLGLRREVSVADLARLVLMPVLNVALSMAREAQRGIGARTVAAAMLGASRAGRRGVNRYTHAGLRALAAMRPLSAPKPQSGAPSAKAGRPS